MKFNYRHLWPGEEADECIYCGHDFDKHGSFTRRKNGYWICECGCGGFQRYFDVVHKAMKCDKHRVERWWIERVKRESGDAG